MHPFELQIWHLFSAVDHKCLQLEQVRSLHNIALVRDADSYPEIIFGYLPETRNVFFDIINSKQFHFFGNL